MTTLDLKRGGRESATGRNVATHPISDAATLVRPASIRNLAHDHTLVLVNGKRRHRSSVNRLVRRGDRRRTGPGHLDHPDHRPGGQVEVLRDGASAQYGSDATAGVLELRRRRRLLAAVWAHVRQRGAHMAPGAD